MPLLAGGVWFSFLMWFGVEAEGDGGILTAGD
jgi:hypothetical protein